MNRSPADARHAQSRNFTIKVRAQTFGLPVECVKTIFHIDALTPVPLAPREVAGLANLRGRIVTALHLDRCLKLDTDGERAPGALAVGIEQHGERYALLIDDTGDVVTCDERDRIAYPTHVGPQLAEATNACYRVGDGFLPILDIDVLLKRMSRQVDAASQREATGGGER
ncbi:MULTISPECIES: chemotaxis protein CheW [Methylosinus]|uniref:Chemotaxis protein CheW n=1 Tax=Methylosinus trichosporium (strain ATCC 35070 / NCIMB 11131 / UNIQEM 75 / OB3b) TaxID=595536 RepID=A0A2D2CYX3_METT3|nr:MULTISPECIES: chemotaxis protein CheW [Methylosinus]ATQ67936.1 chemotaxis protein CheW [Methylosinus trichosporium OB3b]OBS53782.1 chemotaxis protein CheW [Methylosinus sp. 3S-1]